MSPCDVGSAVSTGLTIRKDRWVPFARNRDDALRCVMCVLSHGESIPFVVVRLGFGVGAPGRAAFEQVFKDRYKMTVIMGLVNL